MTCGKIHPSNGGLFIAYGSKEHPYQHGYEILVSKGFRGHNSPIHHTPVNHAPVVHHPTAYYPPAYQTPGPVYQAPGPVYHASVARSPRRDCFHCRNPRANDIGKKCFFCSQIIQ